MKEFLMKEITEEDGVISVTRSRTSTGHEMISIKVGPQSITITNDPNDFGAEYEQVAFKLVKMINTIASDPCMIPGEEK